MRFWNLAHYCMYELQLNFHRLFRFINPVYYLYKIPFLKRYFAKRYNTDDMGQYADDAVFDNPRSGQPIVWAGIQMGIILSSIQIILFNCVQVLIGRNLNNYIFDSEKLKFVAIVSLLTISGFINYYALFKDKKYLIYFEDFNKIPRITIKWYCLFFGLGFISLIVLAIYSFSWLKYI